jgi:hypothetical protein
MTGGYVSNWSSRRVVACSCLLGLDVPCDSHRDLSSRWSSGTALAPVSLGQRIKLDETELTVTSIKTKEQLRISLA